ncbi:MAG TPA: protein kinase [Candidatus Limnocylindrales bacterium]|nr:protein kinase [Candidatus Limnocylindrales bacterium]
MAQTVLFSRYRLLEPVGTGGSAEVWRALDKKTGEEVAVKRLHPIVVADEAGRARLRREFEALQSLDEPHIVRVRDLHVGKREAALILDFVRGQSLAQRLAAVGAGEASAFSPEAAVAIVADVAAALSAAHAAGIVHRDVTPGNILLGPDGVAHLTDFGIARGDTDATAVTAAGQLMGTMRYLAPEQLRGAPSTPASDLHSLAAVAYEMLAGRHAYDVTTPVALAEAQAAGPPPMPGVSAAIDEAVRGGLAIEPSDRPDGVAEFAKTLEAAVAAESTASISIELPRDETALISLAPLSMAAAALGESVAAPRPTATAPGEEIGVALPSRAAATHGSMPQAIGLADRPRPVNPLRGLARLPAPLAGLLAVLLAVGVLAAANSSNPGGATGPTARPAAVVKPTARPTAAPTKEPKGHGHDNGKGKGDGG